MWSIGVIAYILLCGSRPFWARTESGIFRAVLKAEPSFDEAPWPTLTAEARNFVKRLLNKDYRKRMTAAQALSECQFHFAFLHTVIMQLKCQLFTEINDNCRSSVDPQFSASENSTRYDNLQTYEGLYQFIITAKVCFEGMRKIKTFRKIYDNL
jgi:serine/threonine protein kinase